ncbi:MarR family winged helix-turn-helix transcriptional regulator [Deinococcus hopiensis]|uniref:DNA-binding transcriptional regulator, MarR family n=1 Tax=Deinococcus hopiensis KR-140 TaxID=695939 RepID=A0A1W1V633_9DEIO|nr:MarR family winged helix-turn-helix transcriptional regulator [Deinococcus hopiensis]SMB88640.1 DNA-binding transcriptional regulator, MarR family [Deinococcus hopiensis KR-140]
MADPLPSPSEPLAGDLASPELGLLMALWNAWQAMTALSEAHLSAGHGLDLRSCLALAFISDGGRQPAQLAQDLGVPRYEVSRVLRGLEARGTVTRTPTAPDGRRVTVTVTPEGRALWEAALATLRSLTAPPLASLGPDAGRLAGDLHRLARAARLPFPLTVQEQP